MTIKPHPFLTHTRNHLQQKQLVLNFKDSAGDLIEMVDEDDITLMKSEGIPPRRRTDGAHAPWAIYVTEVGDHSPYHTDPYNR